MEQSVIALIDSFPFADAKKVDDLLYYDLPILSRYTFNGKNYLYYHVDFENNINKYLVFKIEEIDLFNLISGITSLRDTILNVSDFVYLADFNSKGVAVKTAMIYSNLVEEDYLPDEDSFLDINFIEDSYYFKLKKKYEAEAHVHRLRKNAFYVKFSSKNKKHGDSIELDELIEDLLPQLTKAYKGYTKADFENNFKGTYTEEKRLSKLYGQINEEIRLRVVDTKFNSFELGLAPDITMMDKTGDKKVVEWAKNISENFKEDVLELDFNNEEEVKKIVNKFSPEQREIIFNPIIKLANNANIDFQYKENKQVKYRTLRKIKESTIDSIVPSRQEPEKPKEYEFVTVAAVLEKGVSKKSILLSNALTLPFDLNPFNLTSEHFSKYNFDYKLKKSIPVAIGNENGIINLQATFEDNLFVVQVEGTNLENATEKLVKYIYEYILNHRS